MPELRATVQSIEATRARLEARGAVFTAQYAFTDVVFLPTTGPSDLNKEVVRLRVYPADGERPPRGVLVQKRSRWQGTAKTAETLLQRAFAEPWEAEHFIAAHFQGTLTRGFDYTREGWEYRLGDCAIYVEAIDGLPPTVEIEGTDEPLVLELLRELDPVEILQDTVPETIRRRRSTPPATP